MAPPPAGSGAARRGGEQAAATGHRHARAAAARRASRRPRSPGPDPGTRPRPGATRGGPTPRVRQGRAPRLNRPWACSRTPYSPTTTSSRGSSAARRPTSGEITTARLSGWWATAARFMSGTSRAQLPGGRSREARPRGRLGGVDPPATRYGLSRAGGARGRERQSGEDQRAAAAWSRASAKACCSHQAQRHPASARSLSPGAPGSPAADSAARKCARQPTTRRDLHAPAQERDAWARVSAAARRRRSGPRCVQIVPAAGAPRARRRPTTPIAPRRQGNGRQGRGEDGLGHPVGQRDREAGGPRLHAVGRVEVRAAQGLLQQVPGRLVGLLAAEGVGCLHQLLGRDAGLGRRRRRRRQPDPPLLRRAQPSLDEASCRRKDPARRARRPQETQPVATGSRASGPRAPQSRRHNPRPPSGRPAAPAPGLDRGHGPGWSQLRAWAEAAPSAASRATPAGGRSGDAPSATREPRRSPPAQAAPIAAGPRTPARAPPSATTTGPSCVRGHEAPQARPGARGRPGARRARRWAAGWGEHPRRRGRRGRQRDPTAGVRSAQTGPDQRRPSCPGSGSGFGWGRGRIRGLPSDRGRRPAPPRQAALARANGCMCQQRAAIAASQGRWSGSGA